MTTTTPFSAWHLESMSYRRSPDNPNFLVHPDGGLFQPITLTEDLNDGKAVLACLRALDAMHRERIRELEDCLEALLNTAENADETGYVTGEGFVDLDKRYADCRAALSAGQKGAMR